MQNQINKETICQSYPCRIEVCGGIASGKTTFAILMKRIGIEPILENFRTNPFWQAFYSDPGKYTFETEISFMLQHYHQIKREYGNGKIKICDFSFFLDIAYTEIGLKDSKLKAFHTVYNEIKQELSPPALLVYLNCDAETELERIRNRGRAVEKSINLEFLDVLNKAVKLQVENAKKKIDVISVDSAQKNFVENELVKQELTDLVFNSLSPILKNASMI
jgi:deoxyadenosine/deoxycytidine kinase